MDAPRVYGQVPQLVGLVRRARGGIVVLGRPASSCDYSPIVVAGEVSKVLSFILGFVLGEMC
jgi:hypothetical protein